MYTPTLANAYTYTYNVHNAYYYIRMDTYQMTFGDNLTQISLHYGYVRIYIFSEFNSKHFTLENFRITKIKHINNFR